MKLSFHGADRDVTGSCHRVEIAGMRLLAAGGRERTILVHGEEGSMETFAKLLPGVPVSMPAPGSELEL